jgi:hypothetical protein
MPRIFRVLTLLSAGAVLAYVAGCSKGPDTPPAEKSEEATKDGEHAHKPGAHGGTIVQVGHDNYHAEPVFEKDGVVRLHLLGKNEADVQEAEARPLTAYVRPTDGKESTPFTLQPEPQADDAKGKASRFVGTLPKELWGRPVVVTVTSIKIDGQRFRFDFPSPEAVAHGDEMPPKVADDDERALYLTPGGLYTKADVEANGNVTASAKFKGLKPTHDDDPKRGDKICPISKTKANPKFTWTVGGKAYEFCCPPCVDEFVQKAKEHPEQVKDPSAYVK